MKREACLVVVTGRETERTALAIDIDQVSFASTKV